MIYWKYICFILLKSEYIPEKSLFLFNFREKLTVLVRSKYHKIYIIVETQHKVGRGGGWQKGGTHEKRIRGGRIKTGNRGTHKTGYRLQKKVLVLNEIWVIPGFIGFRCSTVQVPKELSDSYYTSPAWYETDLWSLIFWRRIVLR